MNYYEELGIRSDADEEEIRKAHRRLVKLMHPDQHRDQSLKQLAETQMRRLNSIVATLLDPEERQEYDEQLRGADTLHAAPQQTAWRSVPWWIASTLGAIILTVGAVWFFADRIGSHINTRSTPPKVDVGPAAETQPQVSAEKQPAAPGQPDPSQTASGAKLSEDVTVAPPVTVPVPDKPKPDVAKAIAAPPAREVAAPAAKSYTPRKTSVQADNVIPVRKFKGDSLPPIPAQPIKNSIGETANLRPPAFAGVAPGGDIPRPNDGYPPPPRAVTGHRDPLEGEWVYAPTEPVKRKPGFYPPEFIELKLTKDTSGMRGEYSARYNVVDNRPVSPNVNFVLKAVDDKSMRYTWTATDGRHGWFVIRQLEPDTMRLEWKDTSSTRSAPTLTSGMATLVRKN